MTPEEKKERKRLYDIEYRIKNAKKKKEQSKEYYLENKEKIALADKSYRLKNKEKKKEYDKKYRLENKDKRKKLGREYYQKNKLELVQKQKQYSIKNKDKINLRFLNKKKNNPLFKLTCNIRSLLKESFKRKGLCKLTKTEIILGCTFNEFKIHLESKFESWMSWDNHGNPKDGVLEINKTWDIDHIIPLSTANTEEEVIRLNHYTNLQPLCSFNNRVIKKDKL